MAANHASDSKGPSLTRRTSCWRRRVSLLGAIGVSVGAANPSMMAGVATTELSRPLMPALADRLPEWTTALLHGRSMETAGLFLMGLTLIAAGRLLTRSDQNADHVRRQAPEDEPEAPVQTRMFVVRTSGRRAG